MSISPNPYVCSACKLALRQHARRHVYRSSHNAVSIQQEQRRAFARPPFAPKPVLDLKHLRFNPGLYEQNCIDRNYVPQARNAWKILELHERLVERQREALDARKRNNALAKELRGGENGVESSREVLLREARELKEILGRFEKEEREIVAEMENLALEVPNLSDGHTPVGDRPKLLGWINERLGPGGSGRQGKSHVDIGKELNILDFEGSASTSGWGWYFLKNEGALLEQALVQFALHCAMARGWQVMTPPSLVYSHMASACGFMPRDQNGETQIYNISATANNNNNNLNNLSSPDEPASPSTAPSLVLAGTAEIPFAGSQANKTLPASSLPLKIIGPSRCYRAEAGARGVDTKGLYRVHEFTKVEMFGWTLPPHQSDKRFDTDEDDGSSSSPSSAEVQDPATTLFDEMLSLQSEILSKLNLHARILEMPSRELGASAKRKVDIEVFFPSRTKRRTTTAAAAATATAATSTTTATTETDDEMVKVTGDGDDIEPNSSGYGEVTSASVCGDYQARRLNTRVRFEREGCRLAWAQTVNGTAMAVPRVLAALLENGWDEKERCVVLPDVLAQWMPEGMMRIGGGGVDKGCRRTNQGHDSSE